MRKTIVATAIGLTFAPLAQAADLQTELMATEKALWTAWGKKDGEPFKKVLTADAVEMVASTTPSVGRDAIVKDIAALPCELRSFSHQDPKLRKLSKDVVVLTYTATQDATCSGKKMPPKVFSTSIYVLRNGKWMQAQYQETPLE